MKHNTPLFKKTLLASAVAACTFGAGSAAVAQPGAPAGESIIHEEVLVRGIRSSLERSVDIKRNSFQMVEAITADDIGKMPDQNIAESLQRLPGIQIDRRDGEGTKVRIRGLDQNITLLNGENFVSGMEYFQLGEWRQNFDGSLEGVPAELLGGVEVYKTPVASLVEGGMGGAVNLKTRNAFALTEPLVAVNLKMDQGMDAKDAKPSGFIVLGNNWNDQFAAIFSLSANTKTVHTDSIQNFSRENTQVRCTAGGSFDSDSLMCLDGDGQALGQSYIAPGMFYVTDSEQERDRIGASLNLQWQVSDALELGFDWFHSNLSIKSRSYTVKHAMSTDDAAGIDESQPFLIDSSQPIGVLRHGTVNIPGAETNSAGEVMDGTADNIALKAAFDNGGAWRVRGALTSARSDHERRAGYADSRFTPYNFTTWTGDSPTGWEHAAHNYGPGDDPDGDNSRSYDYRSGNRPHLAFTNPEWLSNPDYHTYKSHWALGSDVKQDSHSLRTDVEYDIAFKDLRTLKFGFRYAREKVEFTELRWMTDFSRTTGAMSPNLYNADGSLREATTFDPNTPAGVLGVGVREAVYYDLCGNGGIPAGQTCDIDGDGIDDNVPVGPWGYFIDAAIGLKAYDLQTSSGMSMAEALYGPAAVAGGANRWGGSPGYLPWETFQDNPGRYVALNNFFPSGGYQSNVVMADARLITNNVGRWIDGIAPNSPGEWFDVPLNSWEITQSTTAFYGEADFEGETVPYALNVGVRVVNTEVKVTSAVTTPEAAADDWTQATDSWNSQGVLLDWNYETTTKDYWDVLPSMNFVLDTSDQTKLRFSAAKVLARPNLQDLGRGFTRNYTRVDPPDGPTYFGFTGGTSGNPGLAPFRATQADVAFEWYFDDLGLLAIGAFTKSVDSFIAGQTRLEFGADDGPGGGRLGGVSRPQNGAGGSVKGLEFSIQQAFDNGFGGAFNYTYSDSKIDSSTTTNANLGLPGISEHAFNLIGFFENDYLSARLAYTWRDDYLSPFRAQFDVGGLENGASEFYRAYGQWDANITWDINENFSLTGEVINITGEAQSTYLGYKGQTMSYTSQEPRWVIGLNYRM